MARALGTISLAARGAARRRAVGRHKWLLAGGLVGVGALLLGIAAAGAAPKSGKPPAQLEMRGSPGGAAAFSLRLKPRTLLEVRGRIDALAQDGDRIAWVNGSEPCRRRLHFRRLSTGLTSTVRASACDSESLGGGMGGMVIADKRALWVYVSASMSAFHFRLFTAAVGNRSVREVGSVDTERDVDLADEGFRSVPMAGAGQTLFYADISNAEERGPEGVYRVTASNKHVVDSESTRALAVSGGRLVLARYVAAGLPWNEYPSWSPDGSTIAFASTRGAEGGIRKAELYALNAVGTGLRRLTTSGGSVSTYSWAPDGRSLAYQRVRTSESQIFVVASDGTGSRRLATGYWPRWSPDGQSVAYVCRDIRTGDSVCIVPARGGEPTRVVSGGSAPTWSPDGTKIAFLRYSKGLFVVDVASRSTRRVVATEDSLNPPEWSPDGTRIAFARYGETFELHVVNRDGTSDLNLGPIASPGFAWSPDSSTIAVSGTRTKPIELIPAVGGAHRGLLPGWSPAWSPDRRSLVYVTPVPGGEYGGGEIARIASDGSSATTLTQTPQPARERNAVEVRDGKRGNVVASFDTEEVPRALAMSGSRVALLFYRTRSRSRIEVRTLAGSLLRTVVVRRPNWDEIFLSGRWLVYGTGTAIRAIDVKSGRNALLIRARAADLSVSGHRVAWVEERARTSRVRALYLP